MDREFIFRKRESPDYVSDLAREMRKDPTPEEKLLWEKIRCKRIEGSSFRRQRPVGRFIVDFYCPETGLVVEVDGSVHRGREEYDEYRDAFLSAEGYTGLRFTNEEIRNHMNSVLEAIRHKIREIRREG